MRKHEFGARCDRSNRLLDRVSERGRVGASGVVVG